MVCDRVVSGLAIYTEARDLMEQSRRKYGFPWESILMSRLLQTEMLKDSPVDCSKYRSGQVSNFCEELIAVRRALISVLVNRSSEFMRTIWRGWFVKFH